MKDLESEDEGMPSNHEDLQTRVSSPHEDSFIIERVDLEDSSSEILLPGDMAWALSDDEFPLAENEPVIDCQELNYSFGDMDPEDYCSNWCSGPPSCENCTARHFYFKERRKKEERRMTPDICLT